MLAPWLVAWAVLGGAPDEAAIRVEGSVPCLTPAGVQARVTAWSERAEIPADARIELVHEPERLRVRVSTRGAAAIDRTFSPAPSDCNDVELVAAVAIALALDALAEAAAAEALAADEGAPLMPTAREARPAYDDEQPLAWARPDEPLASEPADREAKPYRGEPHGSEPRSRRPSSSIVIAAGGAARELPVPGFTSSVGTRLDWRTLAVSAELELGSRVGAPIGSGVGVVDLVRVAASVGACAKWTRGRWGAGLCAVGLGGPLWARARRTAMPRAALVPQVAAAARSELTVALGPRGWLGLRSDVLLGVVRPSVVATELETDRRVRLATPTVGWRAMLAVGARLGSAGSYGRSGCSRRERARAGEATRLGAHTR